MDSYYGSVHIEAHEDIEATEVMAQDAADAVESAAMLPAAERPVCPDIYVVQPGDTYYGIARKLGITAYEVSMLNPYVDPNALEVGQHLCIPQQSEDGGMPTAAAAREPAQAPEIMPYAVERTPAMPSPTGVALPPVMPRPPTAIPVPPTATLPAMQACPANHARITVQSGGDVSMVLRRYNVSYQALVDANPGVNVDTLHAGQMLCMPPSGARSLCEDGSTFMHIVERSDTLDNIARRYRIPVAGLLCANPHLAPNDFIAGRVICVPKNC